MLTLEKIMNESIWVAKMQGWRAVGTYEEMRAYADSEECRDFDLSADQPEDLKEFYDGYFQYERENGFITIPKYYEEVYAKQNEKKKVWTAEEIKELVQTNDKVLYGALRKLYACQTTDEQAGHEVNHKNGMGFNKFDASILSSFCEFLNRAGFLTDKQKGVARNKLKKYTRQLTVLANM